MRSPTAPMLAVACIATWWAQNSSPRIYADADVRVSFDGGVAHMESYIAASGTRSLLYVVGELRGSGPSGGGLGTRVTGCS